MKDYNQMVDNLFERREQYYKNKEKRIKSAKRVISSLSCLVILLLIVVITTTPSNNVHIDDTTTDKTETSLVLNEDIIISNDVAKSEAKESYAEDVIYSSSFEEDSSDIIDLNFPTNNEILIDNEPAILKINCFFIE